MAEGSNTTLGFEISTLISSGTITNSTFRECKQFQGEIKKCSETCDFVINFFKRDCLYRLTIRPNNIDEIIETDTHEFFLKTQGRPVLEKINKRSIRKSYEILLSQKEEHIFKILFPHFFVLKLIIYDSTEKWRNYLKRVKIYLHSGWLETISYKQRPTQLSSLFEMYSITWETKYYILVLLTNSLMSLSDLIPETFQLLSQYDSAMILKELYYSYKSFSPSVFTKYTTRELSQRPLPDHHIAIKKILVTPTSFCFFPPESEISNRVMRKYSEFSSYFLRLNFCEESLEKRVWPGNSDVLSRFRSLLGNFSLFENDFEFLGFSNSQMRNHSCWMVLKTLDSWSNSIRKDLGDFTSCLTIAKYTCRLGLCFSSTYKTLFIPKERIFHIPEIERNGFKFSDGIGKISPEFLFEARDMLGVSPNEEISAVQIRLGGCKGVVALAPELEYCIAIRPSMCKFYSQDTSLEICSFARFKPAYLNRQIILLLHGLGVPDTVFLELQQGMILQAKRSMDDEDSAIKFIQQYNDQGIYSDLISMLERKIKIKEEPYLQSMLHSIYTSFVADIKERARIFAPDSALLMGVIDEYGVLEYEQVYIRISSSGNSTVATGKVVVTKNPCLHPGDVKVLQAVDAPELAHLANVIVFPQKGPRPHPNECSGSDLDGDEYFVSWNPRLIPPITHDAMEYGALPEAKQNDINIEKVKDYFITYMESENLGTIANLHLMHSDLNGIFSEEALELAELHSEAVDYAKTGKPVKVPYRLKAKSWPDFMQKPLTSYPSPGILGILYRSTVVDDQFVSCKRTVNQKLLVYGFQEYLTHAYDIYNTYKHEIQDLLRKFQLKHECQLFQPRSLMNRNFTQNRKINIVKKVSQIKNCVRKKLLALNQETERRKLASAFYVVCYSQQGEAMQSFPWINCSYLIK